MPDKNYKPGCGKNCLRCWRNKLKHANKVNNLSFKDENYKITEKEVIIQEKKKIYEDYLEERTEDSIDTRPLNLRWLPSDQYGESNTWIHFDDLYDDFRIWYLFNKFKKKIPNKKIFISNISNIVDNDYEICTLQVYGINNIKFII